MIYILLIVFRLTMTSFYFADILPLHMFREWSRNSIRLHWHAHLLNHSICFQIFRKKFQHYGIEFLHVISSLACSLKNLALTYFFTLKQVIRRSFFGHVGCLQSMFKVCSPIVMNQKIFVKINIALTVWPSRHIKILISLIVCAFWFSECAFYHWNPILSMASWHAGFLLPFPTFFVIVII